MQTETLPGSIPASLTNTESPFKAAHKWLGTMWVSVQQPLHSQPTTLTGKTQLARRRIQKKLLSLQGRELLIQKVLFRN